MKRFLENPVIIRIFLVLVLIPLLGFSPRPHQIDKAFYQARLASSFGSYGDAITRVSTILTFVPERSDLWELLGRYALQSGDFSSALSYFERAAQTGKLSLPAQIYLGDAKMLSGDLSSAITIWEDVLRVINSSPDILARLAQAYQEQGDYPKAITALKALVKLQPTDAQHLYQLGLLLTAEEPSNASPYLINAAQINPDFSQSAESIRQKIDTAGLADDPAYLHLEAGRSLAALNYWDLAFRAFQHTTQIRPDYAEGWAYLGEALQHKTNHQDPARSPISGSSNDEAKKSLEKALELDPDSITANTFMALYWQRQERNDLALVYLHNAADIAPKNATLQVEIGNTLASIGNLNAAYSYYQHAVDLAPRDPSFWRSLASFSVKYEYQVRQIALPAARQAILINPQDLDSLDMMGQVFTLLNDRLSAQRFLQRALQIDPGFAPARLHLGLVLMIDGDTTHAREQLSLALSLSDPNSSVADQAERLLQRYPP